MMPPEEVRPLLWRASERLMVDASLDRQHVIRAGGYIGALFSLIELAERRIATAAETDVRPACVDLGRLQHVAGIMVRYQLDDVASDAGRVSDSPVGDPVLYEAIGLVRGALADVYDDSIGL